MVLANSFHRLAIQTIFVFIFTVLSNQSNFQKRTTFIWATVSVNPPASLNSCYDTIHVRMNWVIIYTISITNSHYRLSENEQEGCLYYVHNLTLQIRQFVFNAQSTMMITSGWNFVRINAKIIYTITVAWVLRYCDTTCGSRSFPQQKENKQNKEGNTDNDDLVCSNQNSNLIICAIVTVYIYRQSAKSLHPSVSCKHTSFCLL